VTAAARPRTIHDFGGFPAPLYDVRYPAEGSPELVDRVRELMGSTPVIPDLSWGLDHGTWSVLAHMFPQADVPVVQLSLDETATAVEHVQIAMRLRALRDEGVLLVGSGNVVHNLHTYAWRREVIEPYDWAVRFETTMRQLLQQGDIDGIAGYETLGKDALLSAPTPDHFLPLVYIAAQSLPGETVTFPVEGFDGGSVSMLAVRIG
jgi:4,5-DOPA dioxygenase extradiol